MIDFEIEKVIDAQIFNNETGEQIGSIDKIDNSMRNENISQRKIPFESYTKIYGKLDKICNNINEAKDLQNKPIYHNGQTIGFITEVNEKEGIWKGWMCGTPEIELNAKFDKDNNICIDNERC